MAMQSALSSLLMRPPPGGGGPMVPPNPATLGTGPVPSMPGLPPPPENIGAMPTGSLSSTPKQSADVAIASLRDAKGYFPNLGDQIEALISQLAQGAMQSTTVPAPVGQPGGPGANVPLVPPTVNSGGPGSF